MRSGLFAILVTLVLAGCAGPAAVTAPAATASPPAATPAATVRPSPATPVPSPSGLPVAFCPNPEGGVCLGPVPAGTYTTRAFEPGITYVLPAGWGNYEDLPGNVELLPPGFDLAGVDAGTSDYIGVYTHVIAETQECAGPATEAGRTPAGIAKWLRGQANLTVTAPRKASIGGLDGVVVDIKLPKGFQRVVDWSNGRCVIMGQAPSGLEHGVNPGGSMRLYLLESPVAKGTTLAIEIDDVTGSDALDSYSDVAEHFQFGR